MEVKLTKLNNMETCKNPKKIRSKDTYRIYNEKSGDFILITGNQLYISLMGNTLK